jgi:predicted nucleic acid-binding protein
MQKTIISDTSCLILLDNIGELELLKNIFGTIITTTDIANEFGNPLPNWIQIVNPQNTNQQKIIEATVDKGEASAIALALEFNDSLLIIDDLKGRKFAINIGLKVTGTLGIIVEAKLSGHITSIKPILTKIKSTNFRITESLEKLLLIKSCESI